MDIYFKKVDKAVLPNTYVMEDPIPRKRIRLATIADFSAIRAIYAPYITDTTVTFEYEVPSEEDFEQRLVVIAQTYPILILELDDEIVGYAYSSVFKPRSAYQWTAETVIYLHKNHLNKGLGKPLYLALIEVLKLQRICQAIGVVTSENQASIDFHERLGFVRKAKLDKVGFKFGKWLDVLWMQFQIAELSSNPQPIIPINDIAKTDEFKSLLAEINRNLSL
ncbi:MAG: GNAT family N-acetyltransferase [Bacteroidales bacterium]|nr:GNAT family N-acetyltransferase [Bacteroidales bacterium]